MYMRYYDSYPAAPRRSLSEASEEPEAPKEEITVAEEPSPVSTAGAQEPVVISAKGGKKGFLQSMQMDDILLIALLFLLLSESDDIIMLLIIGYLLLGDVLPI